MSQSINLTHLCLEKEIKYILSNHSHHPYQLILENSDCKQRIVDYVLDNLPNRHMIVKELSELPQESSSFFPQCPLEERIEINKLIFMAIAKITNIESIA